MPKTGKVHHDDDPGSRNKTVGYLEEPDSHTTNGQGGTTVTVQKYKPYLQKGPYGFPPGLLNKDNIEYELHPYYIERVDGGDPHPSKHWIYIAERVRGKKS